MSKKFTIEGRWAQAFVVLLVWGGVDVIRDVSRLVVWVFG